MKCTKLASGSESDTSKLVCLIVAVSFENIFEQIQKFIRFCCNLAQHFKTDTLNKILEFRSIIPEFSSEKADTPQTNVRERRPLLKQPAKFG